MTIEGIPALAWLISFGSGPDSYHPLALGLDSYHPLALGPDSSHPLALGLDSYHPALAWSWLLGCNTASMYCGAGLRVDLIGLLTKSGDPAALKTSGDHLSKISFVISGPFLI